MKEGNIYTFKVIIDNTGMLVTETSYLPINKIQEVFKNKNDVKLINKVLNECSCKLSNMHKYLEDELAALN
tara:strand:+ start:583 stop:795 length:213 start_codon:yes stop_codon:yes gene_type:complete